MNDYMNIIEQMRKHVTIEQLKDYLENKGWAEEPYGRDTVLRFVPPPQSKRYDWDVMIPAYPDLVDYHRVVEIAVDCIAAFEDREVYDVLSDILPSTLVELIELRALIADCERLISKWQGDLSLELSLLSLKKRASILCGINRQPIVLNSGRSVEFDERSIINFYDSDDELIMYLNPSELTAIYAAFHAMVDAKTGER